MNTVETIESVWDRAAHNHDTYSKMDTEKEDISFLVHGVTGEAGELANFQKKQMRARGRKDYTQDMRLETADTLAYTLMVARALGMTLQDLLDTTAFKQEAFVAKMEAELNESP